MLYLAIKKNKSLFVSSCFCSRYFHINYLNHNDNSGKNNGTFDEEALVKVATTFMEHARTSRVADGDSNRRTERRSTTQHNSAAKTEGNFPFLSNPLSHKVYSGKQAFEKKELSSSSDTTQSNRAVNSRFNNLGNKQSDRFHNERKFGNEKNFQINKNQLNTVAVKPIIDGKSVEKIISNREKKRQKHRDIQNQRNQANQFFVKPVFDTKSTVGVKPIVDGKPVEKIISNREKKRQKHRDIQNQRNQANQFFVKPVFDTKSTVGVKSVINVKSTVGVNTADTKPTRDKLFNREIKRQKYRIFQMDKHFQIKKNQLNNVGIKSIGDELSIREIKIKRYNEFLASRRKSNNAGVKSIIESKSTVGVKPTIGFKFTVTAEHKPTTKVTSTTKIKPTTTKIKPTTKVTSTAKIKPTTTKIKPTTKVTSTTKIKSTTKVKSTTKIKPVGKKVSNIDIKRQRKLQTNKNQLNNVRVKSTIGAKSTVASKPIVKPNLRALKRQKYRDLQINKKLINNVGVKAAVSNKHTVTVKPSGKKLSNRALKRQRHQEIQAKKKNVIFYVTQPMSAIKNKKLLAKAANDKQVRFIKYISKKQRLAKKKKLIRDGNLRIQTYKSFLPLGHINNLLTPLKRTVRFVSTSNLNQKVHTLDSNKHRHSIVFISKQQLLNKLPAPTISVIEYKRKQARVSRKYFNGSCITRAFPIYLTGPGFGTLPHYLQTIKFQTSYNGNQRKLRIALEYFDGILSNPLNAYINRYLCLLQELDISRLQSVAVKDHYFRFFILLSKLSRLSNEVLEEKEHFIYCYLDYSVGELQKLRGITNYYFGSRLSDHLNVEFKKPTEEEILRRKAQIIQKKQIAKALYKKEQLKYLIGVEKKGGLPQVIDHKFGSSILYARHLFKKKKKVKSPNKKKLVLLLKYILFYLTFLSKYKVTKNHFYLVSLLETRVTLLNLINSYLNLNIRRLNFSLDLSAVIRSVLAFYEKKSSKVQIKKKSSLSLVKANRKKMLLLAKVKKKKILQLIDFDKKKMLSSVDRKKILSLVRFSKKKMSLRAIARAKARRKEQFINPQSSNKKLIFRTYAALKKHKHNYYWNKKFKQKAFDYIASLSNARRDGTKVSPLKNPTRIAYRIMLFMLCYHKNKAFLLPRNDLLNKRQTSFQNDNFKNLLKYFLKIDSTFFKSYKKMERVLKIKNIISKPVSDNVRIKAPHLDLLKETALSISESDALSYYREMLKRCQVLFYSTFKDRIGRQTKVEINHFLFASLVFDFKRKLCKGNRSNSKEPVNAFDTDIKNRIMGLVYKFGSIKRACINEIINSAELVTSSFDTIKFSDNQLSSFSFKKATRRLVKIQLRIARKYIIKNQPLLVINKEKISTDSIYRMFGGKKLYSELLPHIFIFLHNYFIQNELPKSLLFLLFRNRRFIRKLIKHSHITYKSNLNYVYRSVTAALYPSAAKYSDVKLTVRKLRTLYSTACYSNLCKKYNIYNSKLSKQEHLDRMVMVKKELQQRIFEISLIEDCDLYKYIRVGNRKLVDKINAVKRSKYLKKNVPYNDVLARLVYKKKLLTNFFRLSKKKNKYLSLFLSKRPHLAKYKNDFFIFKNIVNIKETAKLKRRRYFNYKYRELLLLKRKDFNEFLNNRYFDLRNMFNACVSSILPKEYQETHTIIKRIKLDHVNKKKIRQKLNISTSLYLKLKKVRSVLRKKLKQQLSRYPAHLFALNNYRTMLGKSTGVESIVSRLIRFIIAKQKNKKNTKQIKNKIVNTFLYRLSISKDHQALLVFIYLAFCNVLEKTVSSFKFNLSNDVVLSKTNLTSILSKLSDFFIYLNEKQFSFYSYPLLFSYYGFNKNLPFSNKLNPFFSEQTKRKLKPLNTLKYALCKTKLKKSNSIKRDYYSLLAVYNAIKQKNRLKALKSKKAIIYVRTTFTNVFIYFIYENKVICKKTIGELRGLKKKDRRFWRNVYPATKKVLRSFFMHLRQYHFDFVTVYVNGDSSLYSPVISSLSKHRRDIAYKYKGLIRRFKGHFKHSVTRRMFFGRKYILFDNIRHEIIDKCKRFKHISKYYFAVNKIKDITSWPFNGCKLRKNVR